MSQTRAAERGESDRRRWREQRSATETSSSVSEADAFPASTAISTAAAAVAVFDAKGTAAMVEEVVREAVLGTTGNALSEYSAHC